MPEDLRALVETHEARDGRELASKARFLAELDRLASPCDRDADPVHVTASAVVVGPRGTVLHRHRRLGRWLQPGGHVDAGESPAQAAVRETLEETGLVVSHPAGRPELVHLDVHAAADHVHLDLRFLLVAPDRDPSPSPGESPEVRWFTWDEAEEVADVALVGALRAVRAELEPVPDHGG
jgi:8-oxo-dGTP pyrophosphatase MutT (NUDIX family)